MSNTTEAQRLADFAQELSDEGPKIHALVWPLLTGACLMFSDELRRLDAENQQLKTSLALVQQHHATAWHRGHHAGIRAGESAVKQATDAVKADAWGNTQLTNALMQAEAERDQLRAQLAKAVAAEREACKRTCMDIHKRNESAFALECALAIEARSNT